LAEYRKSEAREWARANCVGVANVVIPTFTNDLKNVNEKATRYDIRKEIEYGFWGTLLVSETATTMEEYSQFQQWAVDEAKGKLHFIHHASFNNLEENIQAIQNAERNGCDLALIAYPPNFYAESEDDIFDYTKALLDKSNLGAMLFPVPLWGFERVHPAGMSPSLLRRMVDEIPNVVAVKAEGGMPTIAGFVQTWKELGDKVIVEFPVEDEGLPLAALCNLKWMATSDSEYYGPMIPEIHRLIREGEFSRAMDLYWQIHPARMVHTTVGSMMRGTNFVHRMLWKYEGWLQGFNGGPLRAPTNRLVDSQMKALRQGLIASGLEVTSDPDKEFFVGRNPM
jgi:4-hydroxy-tetrahydrodipicolinate synthase